MMENHPLEALSQIYLSSKNLSKSSIKSYQISFKKYINFLKENDIVYAKTCDVICYRENKRALGFSTYYIYIDICALKGLYRYLRINQNLLDLPAEYAYDIMAPIKNERIKPRMTKPILTVEQAKQLILKTKNNRKYLWQYRDHAIVCLMMTSGLRPHEIISAKRNDYQLIDGIPVLWISKNNETEDKEYVKISKVTEAAINDYLAMRKDDNRYLFISHKKASNEGYLSRTFFRYMFMCLLKECGLENSGITPHCLRHTAGVMNLLRGGSLEATKQLLRHTDISSTVVYANHIERMKDDSEYQIDAFILKEDAVEYQSLIDFLDDF